MKRRKPTRKRAAAIRRERAWWARLTPAQRREIKREQAHQARIRWRVEVVYGGRFDHELDLRIRRTAGRSSDGSGYWFDQRLRDMEFRFVQEPAARRALKRLQTLRPRPRHWKVTLRRVGE